MNKLRCMLAALAVALAACAPPATSGSESVEPLPDAKSDSPSSAAMKYSGGSVLADGVNVYVVWYGSWGAVARPALAKFIADLSGSHYWNILRTYHGAGGKSIRPIVRYAGEVSDAYSAGKSVADYHQVIVDHINAADLPEDPLRLAQSPHARRRDRHQGRVCRPSRTLPLHL